MAAHTIDYRVSQLYKYPMVWFQSKFAMGHFGTEECMRRSIAQSFVVLRSLLLLMA